MFQKGHILVIEDDEEIQKMIERVLRGMGYRLSFAPDFRRGMAIALGKDTPGLILLDYSLPLKDGMTVLRDLRAMPEMDRVPIIMISVIPNSDVVKEAVKEGVSDFLIKPFTPERLVEHIVKWLPPPIPQEAE
jgi:DNA-binding response OmpR family regulator